MYKMSTFQCIVLILTKRQKVTTDEHFNYSSKAINASTIFKISSNDSSFTINLPISTCFQYNCAIYIFSDETFHINVTLQQIIYKGPTGEKCKYGELVAGEETAEDYKESLTICDQHGEEHHGLTFFSKNSSLIMFLYWYNHYSEIRITAQVSLTKCNSIQLDACTIQKICHYRLKDFTRCTSYLKAVSNSYLKAPGTMHLSSLKDYFHESVDAENYVFFSLQNDKCIVIQFRRTIVSLGYIFKRPHCRAQLRPSNVLHPGKEIQYQVKGSLYSFLQHFANRSIKVKPEFLRDHVAFYGPTRNFCFQTSTIGKFNFNCKVTQKKKNKATICKGDISFRIFQSLFKKKDFYIWASQSSSGISNILGLIIWLNLFSKSWVDIIISELNLKKNVGLTLKESVSLPFTLHNFKNAGYRWDHFILLKLGEKLMKSNRLTFNVKLRSCFDGYGNWAKLSWSSLFSFSNLRDVKLISLQGRIYEGTLEMSNTLAHGNTSLTNNLLHLIWLHKSFDDSHFSTKVNGSCSLGLMMKRLHTFDSWFLQCVANHTSLLDRFHAMKKCTIEDSKHNINTHRFKCFIYILTREGKDVLHYKIFSNNLNNMDNNFSQEKLSWIEASNLCKDAGGLLPYFTSRQDLDDLILILKSSRHGFLLEGLFIGLVYNPINMKVKMFHLYNTV